MAAAVSVDVSVDVRLRPEPESAADRRSQADIERENRAILKELDELVKSSDEFGRLDADDEEIFEIRAGRLYLEGIALDRDDAREIVRIVEAAVAAGLLTLSPEHVAAAEFMRTRKKYATESELFRAKAELAAVDYESRVVVNGRHDDEFSELCHYDPPKPAARRRALGATEHPCKPGDWEIGYGVFLTACRERVGLSIDELVEKFNARNPEPSPLVLWPKLLWRWELGWQRPSYFDCRVLAKIYRLPARHIRPLTASFTHVAERAARPFHDWRDDGDDVAAAIAVRRAMSGESGTTPLALGGVAPVTR